jgi:hypothetical protein
MSMFCTETLKNSDINLFKLELVTVIPIVKLSPLLILHCNQTHY